MNIALIAAVAANGVIGCNNQLPWHLPDDLKRFKAITLGKPVIMGRKTFASLGKPLPGRTNIVLTRQPAGHDHDHDGVKTVGSLAAALALAEAVARAQGITELMVIGGATVYQQALPHANRLYLTRLHRSFAGDALFPTIDAQQWQEIACDNQQTADGALAYRYQILDRV